MEEEDEVWLGGCALVKEEDEVEAMDESPELESLLSCSSSRGRRCRRLCILDGSRWCCEGLMTRVEGRLGGQVPVE